ncbi:O-methyltransferase [Sphingobacteriales bacterium CHB3]|nr:O-methyltransferase [Sphingobacteriales bacterium CHB3]
MQEPDLNIVHPLIEEYLKQVSPERDSILTEMETLASKTNFPIVGPLVGRLFTLLASVTNARRIIELGSGFGYSAYWFAQGTSDEAHIICTDSKEENAQRAMEWLRRGGLDTNVDFRIGDALDVLTSEEGPFDIMFCDIDKHDYPRALSLGIPKLRRGGLFLADNVLWKGHILADKPDEKTAAVLTFNRMLYSDSRIFTTILPIRDGISLSMKL